MKDENLSCTTKLWQCFTPCVNREAGDKDDKYTNVNNEPSPLNELS